MKLTTLFLILLLSVTLFTGCSQKNIQSKPTLQKSHFQTVPKERAILLQSGENKNSCAICGMNLTTFYKTNHVADTKEGVKQYCSLHCVVHDNEINKTDLANLRVVDTNSLEFIPALDAYYVVGSSKEGTMSRVSKYAFKTKSEAETFAKKYGGKVMKFYDAYDIAIKDFTKKK